MAKGPFEKLMAGELTYPEYTAEVEASTAEAVGGSVIHLTEVEPQPVQDDSEAE